MCNRIVGVFLFLLVMDFRGFSQSAYQGIQPGTSTQAQVEKVLGRPIKRVSETLIEYAPQSGAQKIYVQYRVGAGVVERIVFPFAPPRQRAEIATSFGFAPQPTASHLNDQGWLEEYFGPPKSAVLSYGGTTVSSGVRQVEYYSPDLFKSAIAAVSTDTETNRRVPASNSKAASQPNANAMPTPPTKSAVTLTPDEIIRRFTTKESELRDIWQASSYLQETRLQVLGPSGNIAGEFYQLMEFTMDKLSGRRMQRLLKAPPENYLTQALLHLTDEERDTLINPSPFPLTAEELSQYQLTYVGKEKIDSLNTHVFEVTPRAMSGSAAGKYFQGRVWVDEQDLQIVKTAGQVLPAFRHGAARLETYREQMRERYWLPTYTVLKFEPGGDKHLRLTIRYQDYR